MKVFRLLPVLAAVLALPVYATEPATTTAQPAAGQLKTVPDQRSYTFGYDIGTFFKDNGFALTPNLVQQGVQDGLSGKPTLMTADEMKTTKTQFQQDIIAKRTEMMQKMAQDQAEKTKTFLAQNKKQKGVITTNSGLQYKVEKLGKGAKPTDKDTVQVNYAGRLSDGKEFDSSAKHGGPFSIALNGMMIEGWKQALKMMPVGSKWEVVIPPDLAYGKDGVPPVIPPNAALVFDIELLSIKPTADVKAKS